MELEHALVDADIPVLLMVLVHLTGDDRWVQPPFLPERSGRLFAEESGGLPLEVQEYVRAEALRLLSTGEVTPHELSDELVLRMMSALVGEPVPAEYLPLVVEDIEIHPRPRLEPVENSDMRVVIVGAGVSGICAAIELQRLGIEYVIVEKNPSVGGTWFENIYPEAGVDTPNHFYSFSFAPNHEWTSYFSKAPEILEYLRSCVSKFRIEKKIIFDTEVVTATFDETSNEWLVECSPGSFGENLLRADVLITAVGQVNRPKIPQIAGLDSFEGEIFHTAKWPEAVDLSGKRVAIVGTGASAVQAARSIASECSDLTIFQRSPQWIMPNPDYHRTVDESKKYLLREIPFYAKWFRFGLFWRYSDGVHESLRIDPGWNSNGQSINETNHRHRGFLTRYLEAQLAGRPDLIAKALPEYPPYGKRMVVDNDWFKTLKRKNVSLISSGVMALTPTSVLSMDGTQTDVDTIIMATGFDATRMLWPMDIVGRDGLSIHEAWNLDDPTTLLGMTTPGFPNMFMLLGPTTSLAHGGSVIFQVEAQVRYIMECLTVMASNKIKTIECRPEAADEYTRRADTAHRSLVFSHPGMNNWYKNRAGKVVTVSPWRLVDYWKMTHEVDFSDYSMTVM